MILFKLDTLKDIKDAIVRRDTPPMDAFQIYRDLITETLEQRGVDATQAYKSDSGLWVVPAQPAPVVLRLVRADEGEENVDYIECMMRLAPLPAKNVLAFYRALLEANMKLSGAAFALSNDGVFLRHQRPLAGLSEEELDVLISSLIAAAEDEFTPLVEQFIFGASIVR